MIEKEHTRLSNIPGSPESASVALEELLAKVAVKDRDAFQTLYQRCSAKLFGVVLRILKNRERAEDVLQDVFLKIWQRAGSYDPAYGTPITWMCAIARNRSIDVIRATRPTRSIEGEGDEEEIYRLGGRTDNAVDMEDLETLRTCLGEMKEDARRYVLQAYYEGLSREELAERYEVPVGTVKSRLRRGLLSLRECLERS